MFYPYILIKEAAAKWKDLWRAGKLSDESKNVLLDKLLPYELSKYQKRTHKMIGQKNVDVRNLIEYFKNINNPGALAKLKGYKQPSQEQINDAIQLTNMQKSRGINYDITKLKKRALTIGHAKGSDIPLVEQMGGYGTRPDNTTGIVDILISPNNHVVDPLGRKVQPSELLYNAINKYKILNRLKKSKNADPSRISELTADYEKAKTKFRDAAKNRKFLSEYNKLQLPKDTAAREKALFGIPAQRHEYAEYKSLVDENSGKAAAKKLQEMQATGEYPIMEGLIFNKGNKVGQHNSANVLIDEAGSLANNPVFQPVRDKYYGPNGIRTTLTGETKLISKALDTTPKEVALGNIEVSPRTYPKIQAKLDSLKQKITNLPPELQILRAQNSANGFPISFKGYELSTIK